jgi:L-fuconolactonase
MRLDAHQHFWDYGRDRADYGWIGPDMEVLRRDYGPHDLKPLLAEIGFDGAVAVQARELEAENDALLALADANPTVKAVVGWLDLCRPDIEERIEHYAAHSAFKGVRMVIHDHPDPAFANRGNHKRGVGMLARHGLSYDLLLKPPYIASAIALVDDLPDTRFVIDHIAKPRIESGWDAEWAELISDIARRDNVWCKLSGMVTEADWSTWREAPYERYLDFVLERFGADRLMIGSDWPVALCVTDYGSTMSIVLDWAARLSTDEQAAITGRTCQTFYRIAS